MKCMIVLLVALAAVVTGFQFTEEWEAWKNEHGQKYENDFIEFRRHKIWEDNKQFVLDHNAHAVQFGYTVEINEFADLEAAEFSELYNRYGQGFLGDTAAAADKDNTTVRKPKLGSVPETVDWRTKRVVTEVKNQGQCGSCWSFSATGSLEGQHAIGTGKLVSLSEQQLMDCSKKFGNAGCSGGLMIGAFRYLESVKGDETEKAYPYKAENQKCKYKESEAVVGVKGYKKITKDNENDLQEAVANVGPISVAIDASHRSFQLYKKGVYSEKKCSQTKLDHGVLAVGYGTDSGKDYWLVKNSWGKSWGMDGYIMMSRNDKNQCGIATSASYPTSVN